MTLDNRIRQDAPALDFTSAGPSGKTGQTHDDYPSPNTQPRYDWMRSYLIGLLSNQSGTSQPNQYREGSIWYQIIDATTDDPRQEYLKIYDGTSFVHLAEKIGIVQSDNSIVSLQTILASILSDVAMISPTCVWSGFFTTGGVCDIPIPTQFQGYAALTNMRAFVYASGLLIDPRICEIPGNSKTYIHIDAGFTSTRNQTYTVELKRIIGIEQATIPAV